MLQRPYTAVIMVILFSTLYNLHMTKFDPKIHHRRSIRLQGYDYSQAGGYFVTIVAWYREFLFGKIVNKEMELSQYGEVVQKWWQEIPVHFPNVETGAFVVMPNHIHGIIFIHEGRGAVPAPDDNVSQNAQGGETPPLQNDQNEIRICPFGRNNEGVIHADVDIVALYDHGIKCVRFARTHYAEL